MLVAVSYLQKNCSSLLLLHAQYTHEKETAHLAMRMAEIRRRMGDASIIWSIEHKLVESVFAAGNLPSRRRILGNA